MKKLAKIRNTRMHKQSGRCYYCGQPMWADDLSDFCERYRLSGKRAARHRCTAEHLIARSDGGQDTLANIVAACLFCNAGRHKRRIPPPPDHYAASVRHRLARGEWHGFIAMPL